jgi:capsular polysaccharide biosynthesis protein
MTEFQTVSIKELSPATDRDTAFSQWRGFVTVAAEEAAAPPQRIFELHDRPGGPWTYLPHWKPPSPTTGPTGCYLLTDVVLDSPGAMRKDERFIDDHTISTAIALAPLKQSPPNVPNLNERNLDGIALLVAGPGYHIWGHWLLEFLPRVAIAQALLQNIREDWVIPVPANTPGWVHDLLAVICGVRKEAIVTYHPGQERLRCAKALVPSFGFSAEYTFHSVMRTIYQRDQFAVHRGRRVCISRSGKAYADARPFPLRGMFEALAASRGFEIVCPETLPLTDQIALFAGASIVIGEYGSAMHSAVFSPKGTIVGCIGQWNAAQIRLGELLEHQGIYLLRGCRWPTAGRGFDLDVTEADLTSFVDLAIAVAKGKVVFRAQT